MCMLPTQILTRLFSSVLFGGEDEILTRALHNNHVLLSVFAIVNDENDLPFLLSLFGLAAPRVVGGPVVLN